MDDTAENSLLEESLLLSSNDTIGDEEYSFPEGYYDLFDSLLETNNTQSAEIDAQNVPSLNSALFEDAAGIENHLEENHADISQAGSPDPLNDPLIETDTQQIPTLLFQDAIDTESPLKETPEDISQVQNYNALLDDDFFSEPLSKNDITVFSKMPRAVSKAVKKSKYIDENLLSASLTKSNSESVVCTAMKQLFVLQHLSFTKDKLRYWFGPAKANSDIKEIIFSMDKDIKEGRLKGKPSIIKNAILKYVKSISFRHKANKFNVFSDDFNRSSSSNILKKITTIEEILGE